MQKMTGQTADIAAENAAKIKELFPACVDAQGNIDFDALKTTLGSVATNDNPSCHIKWAGKEKGRAYALAPSAGTLRPDRSKSVEFNTTKNIYIEGDNLEVLKLLRGSYAGRVKMIYIDPPYNTGKDFVYNDDYSDSIESYKKLVGIVADDGTKLKTNDDTSGRYHTNWLNMMFPRLLLAWELLAKDGVIFISIDDNEVANLRKICDEVFDENNFVAQLVWDLGTGTQAGHFTRAHEYILVYFRDKSIVKNFKGGEGIIDHSALKKITYKNPASDYLFRAGTRWDAPDGTELTGTWGGSEATTLVRGRMICENGTLKEDVVLSAGWAMKDQMKSFFAGEETHDSKGQLVTGFYFNENGVLRYEKERSVINPATILRELGSTKNGTDEIIDLLGKKVFDYPKPTALLKQLISFVCQDSDSQTIVDFFSGSASFAHAAMEWNREKQTHNQFLLVQLQEDLDKALKNADPDAKKTIEEAIAFCDDNNLPRTVCSIGEERIRRAAAKIKAEHPDYKGDLGFKVFTLDSSNVIPWNPDPDKLDLTMLNMQKNLVADRTDEDLLYEILIKKNISLDVDIEKFEVETEENGAKTKNTIYVAGGTLFVCLDRHIPGEVSSEILCLRDELLSRGELDPTIGIQVVFRETGFCDVDKTNALAILEQGGLDDKQIWTL